MKKVLAVGIVPALILVFAAGGAYFLFQSRAEPAKKARQEQRTLVETMELERKQMRPVVRASGAVIPARELSVNPQVNGRITWLNDSLDPGTFVEKGDVLFKIERDDYNLAVRQAEAQVAQAETQLELELGRQEVAKQEWELFKSGLEGKDGEAPPLALRQPQLRSAQVSLESARANLEQAKLNLRRTSVRAPFDAVIVESNAEIDQLVGTQSRVARIVGTEEFWVRVSMPIEKLRYIDIPGINGDSSSEVLVKQHVGGDTLTRKGRVLRLLSDLDPAGRMARILISIEDPYGLAKVDDIDQRPYPILLDAYVDVEIENASTYELIELPRRALRQGDRAYVFDEDEGTLDIRELDIHWRLPDKVLVAGGLEEGDDVVTSPLASAVPGMKLARAPDEESEAREQAEPSQTEDQGASDGESDEQEASND
jgi:RND family efflux transporter MFP subunit